MLTPKYTGKGKRRRSSVSSLASYQSSRRSSVPDHEGYRAVGSGGILRTTVKIKGKNAKKKMKHVVHVSSHLRDAIKQVSKGQQGTGWYSRIHQGCVGVVMGNSTTPNFLGSFLNTDGLAHWANGQLMVQGPCYNSPAGTKSLWNQLGLYTPNLAGAINQGTDLNFFTPGRIINAASVLFNNKTDTNIAQYTLTGNLSTVFNNVGASALTPGTLKIDIKKSWVRFAMKNLSNRVINLDVWQLGTKTKFQNTPPVASISALMNSVSDTVTVDTNFTYNTVFNTNDYPGYLDGAFDAFGYFERVGLQFKGLHREYVMQPDETVIFSIEGPSGVLDYGKLMVDGTVQNALLKDFSTSVVFGVRLDQALQGTGVTYGQRGNLLVPNITNLISSPVSVEFCENYQISVPEVAGFINNATAGQSTQLGFRKNKRVISNFCPNNNSAVSATAANEENPFLSGVTT